MKPPWCSSCGRTLEDLPLEDFETVQFALTDEQRARQAAREDGWVGHPEGLHWFCREHAPLARRYIHLTEADALPRLR